MSILKDLHVERFDGTLDNGIRVVLLYRKGSPVATSAILNAGSQYDPAGIPGAAHFIEHMITNGSEKFPSKDVLAEHIESVGGEFGARTSQEFMIVDTEVSEKTDYDRVVDIFDATLCRPLMDEKVFHNEKNIVIKEIQKSLSNPAKLQWKVGRALFFKGTVLEHEVLGDEKSIGSISYQDMVKLHTQLFDASRITFVASGDITIEEIVAKLNMLNFKTGNSFSKPIVDIKAFPEEKAKAQFFDTTQTHLAFGVPAPKSNSKEMVQLGLLAGILAGGRNARLTKRLRYNKGLIYSINHGRMGDTDNGEWMLVTDTSEDKVQEVISEIILEIKDLYQYGVKESELEFVKNRKIKSIRRATQTSKDWVDFYGATEAALPESADIDIFIKQVEETTIEDMHIIIQNYLGKDKWQLALVGRTKAEDIAYNW